MSDDATPLLRFMNVMYERLEADETPCEIASLLALASATLRALEGAIADNRPRSVIRNKAADIAIYCMMISNVSYGSRR